MNVRLPDGYVEGQQYPTIFEMSGYDGGSADGGTLLNDFGLVPVAEQIPGGSPLSTDDSRQLTELFSDSYVTVHASVRGTGWSSGEFDLFSSRAALDGKEIIAGWIAQQPWSDGRRDAAGTPAGRIALGSRRRHVPRARLPRRGHQLRVPVALDAGGPPCLRHRGRTAAGDRASGGSRRRPEPAGGITPGKTYEYNIETFPVGHVFRPGHRMLVKVHAPPFVDSYYVYVPRTVPAMELPPLTLPTLPALPSTTLPPLTLPQVTLPGVTSPTTSPGSTTTRPTLLPRRGG